MSTEKLTWFVHKPNIIDSVEKNKKNWKQI